MIRDDGKEGGLWGSYLWGCHIVHFEVSSSTVSYLHSIWHRVIGSQTLTRSLTFLYLVVCILASPSYIVIIIIIFDFGLPLDKRRSIGQHQYIHTVLLLTVTYGVCHSPKSCLTTAYNTWYSASVKQPWLERLRM